MQCLSLAIYDSADGPLPYLAVSPNWSEIILGSPALWTQIILNNGDDDEARLHTFLHLSASQVLDVKCAKNAHVQSLRLLPQHRTRIRSLEINNIIEYETIPSPLLSLLGHPTMRQLTLRCPPSYDPILNALIHACPSLQSLDIGGLIDESMIMATLEEARVSIQTLANSEYLYKCTHLRSLTLSEYAVDSIPESEVRNHFLQLSNHLGPRLVNLDISLTLEKFMVFMPYFPSFIALYSATLGVLMPEKELGSRIATAIPKQGTSNLRVLSLRLDPHFPSIHELPTHRDAVGHILGCFSENELLQDLHTFHCAIGNITVESARIASLLRCLSKARVLDLTFMTSETDIAAPIYMPNLLELSLKPLAWLAHIEAPNLIRLGYGFHQIEDNSITVHLSEHFGSKISHLIVDETASKVINEAYSNGVGPRFESLRTLESVIASTIDWVVHIPSIRIIYFSYSFRPSPLNSLLLDLLRHPEALPNLSTIKTRNHPCWELLFEVLRRRNRAQMHRIQELVLPGFPVFSILSRLVKLLQGDTDVYTNRDIDEVIHKRHANNGLTDTCLFCIMAGYIGCPKPISLGDPIPNHSPFLGKDIPVDLLTLESTEPIDVYSKFQGWGDWEALVDEPLHSAILSGWVDHDWVSCSRTGKGEVISEYTLSGIQLTTSLE